MIKTLTITLDVSDLTDAQIASLTCNLSVQAEGYWESDDEELNYPSVQVLDQNVEDDDEHDDCLLCEAGEAMIHNVEPNA